MTNEIRQTEGRRLYLSEGRQEKIWLKLQVMPSQAIALNSFLHEAKVYQDLRQKHSISAMPCAEIVLDHLHGESCYRPILCIKHGETVFKRPCSSLNEMVHTIEMAATALAALHDCGWIHGDLKTEHILQHSEKIHLIDFEQAQSLGYKPTTHLHTATPRYMAPELFQGAAKSLQSDWYAFGIILYEWILQQRFASRSYYNWAILHCQTLQPDLPTELISFKPLIDGLLQKRVQRRFDHLNQVLCALDQAKLNIE